jgi:hypothetical protein
LLAYLGGVYVDLLVAKLGFVSPRRAAAALDEAGGIKDCSGRSLAAKPRAGSARLRAHAVLVPVEAERVLRRDVVPDLHGPVDVVRPIARAPLAVVVAARLPKARPLVRVPAEAGLLVAVVAAGRAA